LWRRSRNNPDLDRRDPGSPTTAPADGIQQRVLAITVVLDSQKLNELIDRLDCLHRAVAAMRGDQNHFRLEHHKDILQINSELAKLRRNKVWLSTRRF
jgi:hypothetical protein